MTTYNSQRGNNVTLTGAGAIAVAFVISLIGAGVDVATGVGLRRIFAVALVLGAVVAALLVRRKDLYLVVISPPLIYILISLLTSIPHSNGAFSSKARLASLVANWLVYGFPEMTAATLLAGLIALIRVVAYRTSQPRRV